jgi:hypothetical protein
MVRAALDKVSRCAAVFCDCVLHEAAIEVGGNIAPVKAKNNSRAIGKLCGLIGIAASFRWVRPTGELKTLVNLLYMMQIDHSPVTPTKGNLRSFSVLVKRS